MTNQRSETKHTGARAVRAGTALALCAAFALSACATRQERSYDFRIEGFETQVAEESAPLGGEALQQMKGRMVRARADLQSFHTTLDALEVRGDSAGLTMFAAFLDAYVGLHLDPLLRPEWQSKHPELMALDATLRIAEAQLYAQLRDPARVGVVLEEIERRYANRKNMLVEYPRDEQTTLGQALQGLEEDKWRG